MEPKLCENIGYIKDTFINNYDRKLYNFLKEGNLYGAIIKAKFSNDEYRMLSIQKAFKFSEQELRNLDTNPDIYGDYLYYDNINRPLTTSELVHYIHDIVKDLTDYYRLEEME